MRNLIKKSAETSLYIKFYKIFVIFERFSEVLYFRKYSGMRPWPQVFLQHSRQCKISQIFKWSHWKHFRNNRRIAEILGSNSCGALIFFFFSVFVFVLLPKKSPGTAPLQFVSNGVLCSSFISDIWRKAEAELYSGPLLRKYILFAFWRG